MEVLGFPTSTTTTGADGVVLKLGVLSRAQTTNLNPAINFETFTRTVRLDSTIEVQLLMFTIAVSPLDVTHPGVPLVGQARDDVSGTVLIVRLSRLGHDVDARDTYPSDYGVIDARLLYQADVANTDSPNQYRYDASPDKTVIFGA